MYLVGILLLMAGLVGLIKPRWLRLPNRWWAGGVLLVGLVLAGLSPEAAAERDQRAEAQSKAEAAKSETEAAKSKAEAERDSLAAVEKTEAKAERDAAATVEARQARIERGFDPWDGNHIALERMIKASLTDPRSYEHARTSYWDQGDHLVVKTWYRARNMLGGMVPGYVMARVDLEGNVLEIVEEGQGAEAIAPAQ